MQPPKATSCACVQANTTNMKTIALICLLAAVLCAAAVQTSESEALSHRRAGHHLEEKIPGILESLLGNQEADQEAPASGLNLASLKEAAKRGNVVINVYPNARHTKHIHLHADELQKLGEEIHEKVSESPDDHGISGMRFRKLMAKIRAIAKDSVQAISALNKKVDSLKAALGDRGSNGASGAPGPRGATGAPGMNGHDGKDGKPGLNGEPASSSAIDSLNAKLAAMQKKVDAADKDLSAMHAKIAKLEKSGVGAPGKDGRNGADGHNGKDGHDGRDGAPGKNGVNGHDGGSANDHKFINEMVAKAVADFNVRIAAVDKAAKAGNTDALKQIAALSVKLGDQIHSIATQLDAKITAVSKTAGPAGKDGKNGANGHDGAPGKNGINGKVGAPGKNGVNGANGKDGAAGKNGVNGRDGANGKNGANGANGKNGAAGKNGVNGQNGTPGKNGANGVNGVNGRDGKDGARGPEGAKGATGAPGGDAFPPVTLPLYLHPDPSSSSWCSRRER